MDKGNARSTLSCRYSCGILVVAACNLRRHDHAHQVVGVGAPPYPTKGVPRKVSGSPRSLMDMTTAAQRHPKMWWGD